MHATLPALLTIGHLLAFLGVGLFIRRRLRILDDHARADDALLTWGLSALAGYFAFWLYFADVRLGVAASVILCGAGLTEMLVMFRSQFRSRAGVGQEQRIELLVLGVALFYVGILYLLKMGLDGGHVAQSRFMTGIPLDNLLPGIFAERLWEGVDPRGFPNGWLSSDRPPLQTGILLVQRPLAVTMGDMFASDLALGIIAQLAWIPAIWSASAAIGQGRRKGALVLAFVILSGFMLFNTVFVWPKLLAGAFAVGSIAQFLRAKLESRALVRSEWLVSSGLAALALLAHSGVAFTLIGLAIVLPAFRRQLDARGLGMAILTGMVLLAPWVAYQKWYEPPANRLAKWHLAGSSAIDNRSFSETFEENYGSRSAMEIAMLKVENLRVLFGSWRGESDLVGIRGFEFRYFFPSFALLNLGWLFLLLRRKAMAPMIDSLAAVALSAIIAWVLLIFGPGWTLAPHGSFGTTILVYLLLGSATVSLDQRIVVPLLVVQGATFLMIWVSPVASDGVWRTVGGLGWDAAIIAICGASTVYASLRALASAPEGGRSAG